MHGNHDRAVSIDATYNGITRTATLTIVAQSSAAQTPLPAALCASASIAPCVTAVSLSTATTPPQHQYSLYSPELNLLAETQSTSASAPAIAYEYVWFAGVPLAQIETSSGETHYYFNDHLGTPLLTTNSTGAIDWRAEREPYGNIILTRAGSTRHQPLAFPGQEDDKTGDRSYNIFRWYRAGWGRYTQADPLAFVGRSSRAAIDLFSYARGNPIANEDPLGLYTIGRNCDDRLCGPPSPGLCGSNPRSGVCIDDLFRRLRNHIRSSSDCQRALNNFGSGFDATDVIRSTFPGTPGPRMTCDARDCDPSRFGGYRDPHYNPFTRTIPVCLSLYDSRNSLLHELLHWFGVPDLSAQQRVLLRRCFPGDEP